MATCLIRRGFTAGRARPFPLSAGVTAGGDRVPFRFRVDARSISRTMTPCVRTDSRPSDGTPWISDSTWCKRRTLRGKSSGCFSEGGIDGCMDVRLSLPQASGRPVA